LKLSPIPKPPRQPNPVQKAIRELIEETQRKGTAQIDGVIVHPEDLKALKELMNDEFATRSSVRSAVLSSPATYMGVPIHSSSAVAPTSKRQPGQLLKVYEKQVAEEKLRLLQGQRWDGISWDEQHSHDKTELERQLEASLWAVATLHQMVHTREELDSHVGPGHMEDTWYVKKTNGENEVFLLCKCRVILVFARCYWVDDLTGEQCEEPAFPAEGTLRKDTRCGLHTPMKQCNYVDYSGARCQERVAATVAHGRCHWHD
jgi:hypothetical protein